MVENINNYPEEDLDSLIQGYKALVESYYNGLVKGLELYILNEVKIPEKLKKIAKYLGLGALGAGALAGAAYAGAHADQIGQQISNAKDVVQQKLQSLINHIRGEATQVVQPNQ